MNNEKVDAAFKYQDAGKLFSKEGKLTEGEKLYDTAIDVYEELGQGERANKARKEYLDIVASAFGEGKVDPRQFTKLVQETVESMMRNGEKKDAQGLQMKMVTGLVKAGQYQEADRLTEGMLSNSMMDIDIDPSLLMEKVIIRLFTNLLYKASENDFKVRISNL